MDTNTFHRFRDLIYRESGIVLTDQKKSLLASRIQKRLNALGAINETDYLKYLERDNSGVELVQLLDAVSTNVTYFYREETHFSQFREIIEERVREGAQKIQIWCAAASSGEEPYTIAFEALEAIGRGTQQVRILGTDICVPVLERAIGGAYPEGAVAKIPSHIRAKYMQRLGKDGDWQVIEPVRQMLLFKRLNLVEQPYPLKGPFDVIFCRNVMIYFDNPTRQTIVKEFTRLLRPGGYLFLSHSENLLGVDHALEKIGASVFQKRG